MMPAMVDGVGGDVMLMRWLGGKGARGVRVWRCPMSVSVGVGIWNCTMTHDQKNEDQPMPRHHTYHAMLMLVTPPNHTRQALYSVVII